jgi:MFS family permease
MTHSMSSTRRWLALGVVCLGVLMVVLDVTIVNVALPSIRADLGFSETTLVWVVNAYLLTCGGFPPPRRPARRPVRPSPRLPGRHRPLHRCLARLRPGDPRRCRS